jgi:TolB-like protein/Tfp pilus assembly protein PilF
MASLIPGFEYDIFISYRQKDNKYDGWVTEFVDNLKKELEATFKEEISVYFDINPHDGLLETHDVDASLKEKLKCLIFIPIISRTYCDPKSFAWEHEFKAFVDQASLDQFGLKVKVPNGNVAGRVLPVRIHELDSADIKLCESLLDGVLRGVQFIYAEPGVNRPLKSDDDEKANLNKTKYRNQINKVANAVNELISGLKAISVSEGKGKPHQLLSEQLKTEEEKTEKGRPAGIRGRKILTGIFIILALVVSAVLFYPELFNLNTKKKLKANGGETTVAIFPFQNLTNDTIWNVWQDGIQDNLITSLSGFENLKVRQTESINKLLKSSNITEYASITPSLAINFSRKLKSNILITGSIHKAGGSIRVNAQVTNSETERTLTGYQIDGTPENILHIIDSLSALISNTLEISELTSDKTPEWRKLASSESPEAYQFYILGDKAMNGDDYMTAIKFFSQALAADTNFLVAEIKIALAYYNSQIYDEAKKSCLKVYEKRDRFPLKQQILINWLYSLLFENPHEQIKYLVQLQSLDDQMISVYSLLGAEYCMMFDYEKAIPEFEKVIDLYKKWDVKPPWPGVYSAMIFVYYQSGQYKKAEKMQKKDIREFPDDFTVLTQQAWLSWRKSDTVMVNQCVEKIKAKFREESYPESIIYGLLGYLFSSGNIPDKAEMFYRKALSLDPENPSMMNDLAYTLIKYDLNITEGNDLSEKVLKAIPAQYAFLHTRGWGLYKEGKYKEALSMLQQSWDLRMRDAVYDHEAFLHLEEAKKAVAGMK